MTEIPETIQKAGGNMKDGQDRTDEISREQGQEKIKEKVSGWYYADLAVAIAVLIGLGATGVSLFFSFSIKLVFLAPVAAAIIGAAVFVYKDKYQLQLPKPLRIVSGIVRGILYTAAAVAFAIPCIMLFVKSPVFYNIQREIFGEMFADHGKGFLRYIPEEIPENAENYSITCFPGFVQNGPHFMISFSTTQEQLDEYRDFAKANGAALWSTNEELNRSTDCYEPAEQWVFTSSLYHSTYYLIYPESGYFVAESN